MDGVDTAVAHAAKVESGSHPRGNPFRALDTYEEGESRASKGKKDGRISNKINKYLPYAAGLLYLTE